MRLVVGAERDLYGAALVLALQQRILLRDIGGGADPAYAPIGRAHGDGSTIAGHVEHQLAIGGARKPGAAPQRFRLGLLHIGVAVGLAEIHLAGGDRHRAPQIGGIDLLAHRAAHQQQRTAGGDAELRLAAIGSAGRRIEGGGRGRREGRARQVRLRPS